MGLYAGVTFDLHPCWQPGGVGVVGVASGDSVLHVSGVLKVGERGLGHNRASEPLKCSGFAGLAHSEWADSIVSDVAKLWGRDLGHNRASEPPTCMVQVDSGGYDVVRLWGRNLGHNRASEPPTRV